MFISITKLQYKPKSFFHCRPPLSTTTNVPDRHWLGIENHKNNFSRVKIVFNLFLLVIAFVRICPMTDHYICLCSIREYECEGRFVVPNAPSWIHSLQGI